MVKHAPSEKKPVSKRLMIGIVGTMIVVAVIGFFVFSKSKTIGSTRRGNDGMTLVYVPAGEFTMGSEDGNPDERPVQKVTLAAFWIDRTEISNKMYSLCVADNVCKKPTDNSSGTRLNYYGNPDYDNFPVIQVGWIMASSYCEWAGRRLPTEAEWEKAARGTDARTYPWGDTAPNENLLNYNNAVGDTTAVGSYPNNASPYGALDLAGNVTEWVADWYDIYPGGNASASPGDFGNKFRVLRGGAWNDTASGVRSTYRNGLIVSNANSRLGFRCARDTGLFY